MKNKTLNFKDAQKATVKDFPLYVPLSSIGVDDHNLEICKLCDKIAKNSNIDIHSITFTFIKTLGGHIYVIDWNKFDEYIKTIGLNVEYFKYGRRELFVKFINGVEIFVLDGTVRVLKDNMEIGYGEYRKDNEDDI